MKKGINGLLVGVFMLLGNTEAMAYLSDEILSENLSQDIQTVKTRLYQYSLETPDIPLIEGYMKTQQQDGGWTDINYQDKKKSGWEPLLHLRRLLAMVEAYRNPDSELYSNSELKEKALGALDFWFACRIKGSSSWLNLIGIPKTLGPLLLLLEDELTPVQMENGLYVMDYEVRYKKWKHQEHLRYWWNDGEAAGQNKLWMIRVQLFAGVLRGQSDVVQACFSSAAEEFRVDRPQLRDISKGNEGIQVDSSFHQHGPQLYSGGYGLGFAADAAYFLSLAQGTQFEFSKEQQDFILSYILDGQQWMIYKGVFDYSALGREISRQGISHKGNQMLAACDYLSELDLPRREELQTFGRQLQDNDLQQTLTGHRHFWYSDFSVHRGTNYYVSVKMNSSRTLGTEMGNGEGLKNYYLAEGCTYIFIDGDEYNDIFPIWDWTRIPGTTCERTETPPPLEKWGGKDGVDTVSRGATDFVGGISDGTYGLAAMDYQKDAVKARKAWFCFENEIVCLGSGVSCSSSNSVATSVNQCLLKGDIQVSSGEKVTRGEHLSEASQWLLHAGVGYVFPEEARIHLKTEAQSGSWHSINQRYSDEQISRDVFSLWIDHGTVPFEQTYYYIVVPSADEKELSAYMNRTQSVIEVLSNTSSIQSVRNRKLGVTQVAFYEAGFVDLGDNLFVRVDNPCLLMLSENEGEIQLAVSNPENKELSFTVEMNMPLAGEGCLWSDQDKISRIKVDLPDGIYAGQTVVRTFIKHPSAQRIGGDR